MATVRIKKGIFSIWIIMMKQGKDIEKHYYLRIPGRIEKKAELRRRRLSMS